MWERGAWAIALVDLNEEEDMEGGGVGRRKWREGEWRLERLGVAGGNFVERHILFRIKEFIGNQCRTLYTLKFRLKYYYTE